ncbi:MAG: hypothetical protein ABIQ88_12195 [Chitinophagaceae bacterium]
MSKINLDHLHKKWVHSSEEDTDTQTVYRPAEYKLPPSRGGRTSLDIQPDGTLISTGDAGPDDRQAQKKETWKINANTLVLNEAGNKKSLHILSLAAEKLVIKK